MIRKIRNEDAKEVAELIKRTLYEVNIKDYSIKDLENSSIQLSPEDLKKRVEENSYYVVEEDKKIIGVGGIGSYNGRKDESYIMSVFVLPEYIGKGIGRRIIEALEADEYFKRAKRTEVASSITALEFYKKLGYSYKDGIEEKNEEEQNYRLEKFNI